MAERIKRVIERMQGDPSRTFSLGEMAESVNLSPPYFCYLFKSITGVPPARYLKTLRLQQAATLLTTTFLSVKEIVSRVGCTDESHFVRDFKRLYGVTPSEYRNGVQPENECHTSRIANAKVRLTDLKNGQLIILASLLQLV